MFYPLSTEPLNIRIHQRRREPIQFRISAQGNPDASLLGISGELKALPIRKAGRIDASETEVDPDPFSDGSPFFSPATARKNPGITDDGNSRNSVAFSGVIS
jgi:hypothetical protein